MHCIVSLISLLVLVTTNIQAQDCASLKTDSDCCYAIAEDDTRTEEEYWCQINDPTHYTRCLCQFFQSKRVNDTKLSLLKEQWESLDLRNKDRLRRKDQLLNEAYQIEQNPNYDLEMRNKALSLLNQALSIVESLEIFSQSEGIGVLSQEQQQIDKQRKIDFVSNEIVSLKAVDEKDSFITSDEENEIVVSVSDVIEEINEMDFDNANNDSNSTNEWTQAALEISNLKESLLKVSHFKIDGMIATYTFSSDGIRVNHNTIDLSKLQDVRNGYDKTSIMLTFTEKARTSKCFSGPCSGSSFSHRKAFFEIEDHNASRQLIKNFNILLEIARRRRE